MKIYQIYVKGFQKYFNDYFKMHSKQVYRRKPTKQEIKKFIDACCDEEVNPLFVLNTKTDYRVKILELELEEDEDDGVC